MYAPLVAAAIGGRSGSGKGSFQYLFDVNTAVGTGTFANFEFTVQNAVLRLGGQEFQLGVGPRLVLVTADGTVRSSEPLSDSVWGKTDLSHTLAR